MTGKDIAERLNACWPLAGLSWTADDAPADGFVGAVARAGEDDAVELSVDFIADRQEWQVGAAAGDLEARPVKCTTFEEAVEAARAVRAELVQLLEQLLWQAAALAPAGGGR